MKPIMPSTPEQELASLLTFFLLNNPYKKTKRALWKQYTAWVHLPAEGAHSKEHADMLFLYERLTELLKETNVVVNKTTSAVKR